MLTSFNRFFGIFFVFGICATVLTACVSKNIDESHNSFIIENNKTTLIDDKTSDSSSIESITDKITDEAPNKTINVEEIPVQSTEPAIIEENLPYPLLCRVNYSESLPDGNCNVKYGQVESSCQITRASIKAYKCETNLRLTVNNSEMSVTGNFSGIHCASTRTSFNGTAYIFECTSLIRCFDSDNGKDYNTAGYIDHLDPISNDLGPNDTEFRRYDTCINQTLNEFYCVNSKSATVIAANCPNGCQDGKCYGTDKCIMKGNKIIEAASWKCCSGLKEVESNYVKDGRTYTEHYCE
jgi:hypothetical protein